MQLNRYERREDERIVSTQELKRFQLCALVVNECERECTIVLSANRPVREKQESCIVLLTARHDHPQTKKSGGATLGFSRSRLSLNGYRSGTFTRLARGCE